VNCLVPRDPDIRILAQNRNYSQSFYELDFVQAGGRSNSLTVAWMQGIRQPLGTVALLLFAWLALLWGQRAKAVKTSVAVPLDVSNQSGEWWARPRQDSNL